MEFVSMDLIGEFHPPSSKGNRVCINCCMYAYRLHILHTHQEQVGRGDSDSLEKSHAFPFGVCRKLLMDNGTEFKNDLFFRVAEQLGVEQKNVFTSIQAAIKW